MILNIEKITLIEKKLEEQTVLLKGMETVMKSKRSFIPRKEMLKIIFELNKILDEIVHLKNDYEKSIQ